MRHLSPILASAAAIVCLASCSGLVTTEPLPPGTATFPLTLEMRELEQVTGLRDVAIEIQAERCMIDLGFPRVDRVSFATSRQDRSAVEPLHACMDRCSAGLCYRR